MVGANHLTEITETAPGSLLGEAEAGEGAERVGVRVVYSYSEVNWIYGLDVVLPHKSVSLELVTAPMEPLPTCNLAVIIYRSTMIIGRNETEGKLTVSEFGYYLAWGVLLIAGGSLLCPTSKLGFIIGLIGFGIAIFIQDLGDKTWTNPFLCTLVEKRDDK